MQAFLLVLTLGVTAGWMSRRVGLPAAVGQVALGAVLGPAVLGWVAPDEALRLLAEIGVVLLLGMAGLHIGLERLVAAGWPAWWVALLGIAMPLGGGYVAASWWGSPEPEALYVGVALAATSIGISVQVLHQFGLLRSWIGEVVVAAAVIDDVIALYLLAVAHGVLSGGFSISRLGGSLALALASLGALFWVSRWAAQRIAGKSFRAPAAIVLILAAGWATAGLGLSAVVGGFFAGLGIGEGVDRQRREQLTGSLDRLVLMLVPFFFVLIGVAAEWDVVAEPGMTSLFLACWASPWWERYWAAWRAPSAAVSGRPWSWGPAWPLGARWPWSWRIWDSGRGTSTIMCS
ncbi:MAG: cation:proton antiporter [Pseudomonadota bacterium]|nr:cation:proton antiporter [Pseudomonadota bacterium]